MPKGCTLFIYLLEDGQGHGRYFAAMVPKDLSQRPLAPSRQTHEISTARKSVIDAIQSLYNNKNNLKETNFKKNIGLVIAKDLGLNKFFSEVIKHTFEAEVEELTLLTNDVEIPWEWAYFESKEKFFCEIVDYGKLLPERVLPGRDYSSIVQVRDASAQLASKHAILLYDDYKGKDYELPNVVKEIQEVAQLLKHAGIPEKNIHYIYGGDKRAEFKFTKAMHAYHDNLILIHFSGHFGNSGIILSDRDTVIESQEIADIMHGQKLCGTLIFLNACLTGKIKEIWDTEQNMSTAFLEAGAAGCVCTLQSVIDNYAKDFAKKFYSTIFIDHTDLTISEALRKTRIEVNNIPRVHTLLWTFYGSPNTILLFEDIKT